MVKKLWILLGLGLLLTGCGAQQTFETVDDVQAAPAMAQMRQVTIALPNDAVLPTVENDTTGKLYLCDGYAVAVQTMEAGDLDSTLRQLTGFDRERLTLMQTEQSGVKRYDCVWTAVGEGGDHVCRGVILDDGDYHYTVTVMAEFSVAGDLTETWQTLLDSVSLSTD